MTRNTLWKSFWKKQHEEGNVDVWQVDALCTPSKRKHTHTCWVARRIVCWREGYWFGLGTSYVPIASQKNSFSLVWPDDLTPQMSLSSHVAGAPFDRATVFPVCNAQRKSCQCCIAIHSDSWRTFEEGYLEMAQKHAIMLHVTSMCHIHWGVGRNRQALKKSNCIEFRVKCNVVQS